MDGEDRIAWLARCAKARDEARDWVESIWKAFFREDDLESFVDYWVVGDKVRVARMWKGSPVSESDPAWEDYPAQAFASEGDAKAAAEKWRASKREREKAEAAAREEKWKRERRERDLAELKRLKAEYEKAGETGPRVSA